MTLEDIINQLETGELSQIALTERVNGNLTEDAKRALVTHVNMGLTALHRRFVLQNKDAVIALQPGQFQYTLDKKYAASNTESLEPVKYIQDLENPFEDTVMQIEGVTDDLGNDVPLDNASRGNSLRSVNYKTLVLPPRNESNRYEHLLDYSDTMTVIYRANHRPLKHMDMIMPANMVEIDLPDTHLEALVYFVASRVMNPIGMNETFHAGNNYAAKYERACQQLTDGGFGISSPGQGDNFSNNGWV